MKCELLDFKPGWKIIRGSADVVDLVVSDLSIDRISIEDCPNLRSVKLPGALSFLDVSHCPSLASVTLPAGVIFLSFKNCPALKNLDLSGQLHPSVFITGAGAVRRLQVPASVKSLSVAACSALAEIEFSAPLCRLDIKDCPVLELKKLPSGGVGELVLDRLESVERLNVPEGTESLVLKFMESLGELRLPETLRNLRIIRTGKLGTIEVRSDLESLTLSGLPGLKILMRPRNIRNRHVTDCPALKYEHTVHTAR